MALVHLRPWFTYQYWEKWNLIANFSGQLHVFTSGRSRVDFFQPKPTHGLPNPCRPLVFTKLCKTSMKKFSLRIFQMYPWKQKLKVLKFLENFRLWRQKYILVENFCHKFDPPDVCTKIHDDFAAHLCNCELLLRMANMRTDVYQPYFREGIDRVENVPDAANAFDLCEPGTG